MRRKFSTVARSLREASKMTHVTELDLSSSDSFVCKNMMCEFVGESCICRLALWTYQNQTKLSTLKTLNLSSNTLTKLPDTLFDFNTIEKLDLSFNRLQHIPETITNLSSLTVLDLRGNPILSEDSTNKNVLEQLNTNCKVLFD